MVRHVYLFLAPYVVGMPGHRRVDGRVILGEVPETNKLELCFVNATRRHYNIVSIIEI